MKEKAKLKDILIKIIKEVHIINNLKTKLLMKMNLLRLKEAIINILKQRIQ